MQKRMITSSSLLIVIVLAVCAALADPEGSQEMEATSRESSRSLKVSTVATNRAAAGRKRARGTLAVKRSATIREVTRSFASGRDAVEIARLRELIALQQKQIDELRDAMNQLRQHLERASQSEPVLSSQRPEGSQVASLQPVVPVASKRKPRVAGAASLPPQPPLMASSTLAPGRGTSEVATRSGVEGSKEKPAPLSIRIGDADFTIGGFLDFTTIYRSTNAGSGIGTSFGSIPFSNTIQGRLSETRFSAQNSRLSLKVTAKAGAQTVTGYVETDFLGAQPANAFVTSNSNSLRLRLYWVDVQRGRFEVMAGQSWSMLNPNRVGLSPLPSDVFYSQNMDTNYQVGLTWSRDPQVRFIVHAAKGLTAGLSLENPQQFVGGEVVLPSGFDASQIDTGSNLATPNLHPDFIPKVAYEGDVGGRKMHVEVAGLLRSFRVFNPATRTTSTIAGGGGSVNANLELWKNFHLILNSFYSDGGGRYIFGLGPDLIIKPDGTPSAVHAGSGIGGFEWQFNLNTMLYGYYGGAYYQRNTAIDPKTGKFVGFGFPGSSSAANRSVQEGTFGVIQTFWKNPRYGALQLITQYSYLTRSAWSVVVGAPKNAHSSMGYVDLRYVLP